MRFGKMDPMFVPANPTGIRPLNDPQLEDDFIEPEDREEGDPMPPEEGSVPEPSKAVGWSPRRC